jgi:hypothetical protein
MRDSKEVSMTTQQFSESNLALPQVTHLAQQALSLAASATPLLQTGRPTLTLGLPPAQALLTADSAPLDLHAPLTDLLAAAQAAPAKPPRVDDLLGHSRTVYHPYLLHLCICARAQRKIDEPPADDSLISLLLKSAEPALRYLDADVPSDDLALVMWEAACLIDHRRVIGPNERSDRATAVVERITQRHQTARCLHPHQPDDLLDAWTYRELSALHALFHLAVMEDRPDWRQRAHAVAMFHLEHTQPDYTTYQPWALAAFVDQSATRTFADQQLHDAQTHLHLQGSSGAVMIALLLADAAFTLRHHPAQS